MSHRELSTFDRRKLLAGSAAVTANAMLPGTALAMSGRPKTNRAPGIQLYTVHESMGEDLLITLDAIAGMGYREVEFAGYFDHRPSALRRILDERGLRAPSSHVSAHALRDEPEAVIEAAAELGNDCATIGWLDPSDRRSIGDYRRWAETLNRTGDIGRSYGVQAAYHNHEFEFKKLDGAVPYYVLLNETDAELVAFELDFFWVKKAGFDIGEVLSSAPTRFRMAHIKDMDDKGNMVDVGWGNIDFYEILCAPEAAHIKHFFVEHDEPANPFRTAAAGRRALSEIFSRI